MNKLYKSILDDEDALIGDAIKESKNPFLTIKNNYIKRGNKFSIEDLEVLDKKVFTYKYSKYKYKKYVNFKKEYDEGNHIIKPKYKWRYTDSYINLLDSNDIDLLFIFFTDAGTLNIYIENCNNDWIDFRSHIIDKYNLTLDVHNYYII